MSTPTSEPSAPATPSLSQLYRDATARHGDRTGCLDADTLLDLVRGELSAQQRRKAVQHLADCSDCSREYRVLQQHPNEEWPIKPSVPSQGFRPFNRTLHRWTTIAAAAGLILTVAIFFWQSRLQLALDNDDDLGTLRSTAAEAATTPPGGAILDEAPRALSWPYVEDTNESAAAFRVRLYDSQGRLLVEDSVVGRSTYPLPAAVVDELRAGGRFLWTVDSTGQRFGPLWFETMPEPGEQPPQVEIPESRSSN